MRTVFERVLGSPEMDKERTGELWNTLLEFEYAAGDLASIQKLEKRRAQFFPELGTLQPFLFTLRKVLLT